MTYGLIGEKLGHSYSKQIHESLGRYTYDLLSLSREELEIYLKKREFSGLNITIPIKKRFFRSAIRFRNSHRRLAQSTHFIFVTAFSAEPIPITPGFFMRLPAPAFLFPEKKS